MTARGHIIEYIHMTVVTPPLINLWYPYTRIPQTSKTKKRIVLQTTISIIYQQPTLEFAARHDAALTIYGLRYMSIYIHFILFSSYKLLATHD